MSFIYTFLGKMTNIKQLKDSLICWLLFSRVNIKEILIALALLIWKTPSACILRLCSRKINVFLVFMWWSLTIKGANIALCILYYICYSVHQMMSTLARKTVTCKIEGERKMTSLFLSVFSWRKAGINKH